MSITLTVPTIEAQTGAVRAGPVALIQNGDLLVKVTQCDYDLFAAGFAEYCRARGVSLWKEALWPLFNAATFIARADYDQQFGHSIHGQAYSADSMDSHWRRTLIARGALQDVWQLWLASQAAKAE